MTDKCIKQSSEEDVTLVDMGMRYERAPGMGKRSNE